MWVGRKLYARYEHANKHKRNLAIAGGVTAAVSTDQILSLLYLHVVGNRVNEKIVVTVLNWFFRLLQHWAVLQLGWSVTSLWVQSQDSV